ncbi:MAG: ribonuclease Y [Actinobacteria bacterium]|nr:MAG: ribonuclease Y [Actinomycetota bacterium]
MEIFVGAAVAAVVSALVVVLMGRTRVAHAGPRVGPAPSPATRAEVSAATATTTPPAGGSPARAPKLAIEDELRERRAEIVRIEERILSKEEKLAVRLAELERRETSLEDRQRNLDREAGKLKAAKQDQLRELERISGLSPGQARQVLLRELEDEIRHDSARLVRQIEDEARRDADRRARSILSTVMQRVAGGHAAETTVSVVQLESDDLKGRIIGREGRNIRTLETLTGIDFIIDDTPSAVILSGFDGVRREVARLTLEKLLQDGRIHPARIEESYYQTRSEIENRIAEVGEQAVLEANVGSVHPELSKLLGRLHYRTSYGQNVLDHSIECARLASLLASELGANEKTAARAALMHDIGKAVSHETEGPHALVGGEIARRYGESEAVAHAMEAHHNEVELRTVEAVVVQIVDSLSGARPGARGESLEQYTKRLRDLESIATRHAGVEKVYAMQAGREIRVIVHPEEVDDDTAALLSHRIARDVEKELEYAGQIKVTVIRESRNVDFAK